MNSFIFTVQNYNIKKNENNVRTNDGNFCNVKTSAIRKSKNVHRKNKKNR